MPTQPLLPAQMDFLKSWEGRTETAEDTLSVAPAEGMAALLDQAHAPRPGDCLPPLWHWMYCLPRTAQSALGADGHARLGDFLPPVPLPRRMWAGGQFEWRPDNPLRIGQAVARRSTIDSVTAKQGRSGGLVFVRVRHALHNEQGLALVEHHDIVYRGAAVSADSAPPSEKEPAVSAWRRPVRPDPVLLFRYSALTFNGHRIHYDRRHATEVEGYPGLIVHGPLIATLLIEQVREYLPAARIRRFAFRAVRPVFDHQTFTLNGMPAADGQSVHLWAAHEDQTLAMTATAELDAQVAP